MLEEKESFWKKKGFYLSTCAAILCVLAIGTLYYKINYQNNDGKNLFADSATTAPSSATSDTANGITSDVAGSSAIEEAKNDTPSEDSVSVSQNNTQQNTSDIQPTNVPDSTPDSGANNQNDQDSQDTSSDNKSADNNSKKASTSEKYVADASTTNKSKKLDSTKTAKIKDSKASKDSNKSADNTDSKDSTDNTVATMKGTGTKNKFDMEKGLLWPVTGDVILKYSMSNTVYFKTLAQYKCNPAVIISSKEGTNVKAAADGTVSKVTKSDEVGNLITVDIGNGYSVTYGQLDGISVKEGQYIKEGSTIAQIAKPTKYYSEEGSNLYLQVTENDKPVDPMLLLR